jgi:hypothetical protein
VKLNVTVYLGLLAGAAVAQAGQVTTPIGDAFAEACAGNGSSFLGSVNPGTDINGGVSTASVNCATQVSALAAPNPQSNGGSVFGNPWNNSAAATAAVGQFHLGAQNSGSGATDFSSGETEGGWNDTFTINPNDPNLINVIGNTALWVTEVHIDGHLQSNGEGAMSLFQVAAFQNHNALTGNAFNTFASRNQTHNGPIQAGWDFEMSAFETNDAGLGNPFTLDSMDVNTTVFFVFPVTFGVAFEGGFFGIAGAGEAYSGGPAVANTSSIDFSHTVTWDGPGLLIGSDNQTYTGFTVTSGSGFNYNEAFGAPEPSAAPVLLIGLALFALGIRRRNVAR